MSPPTGRDGGPAFPTPATTNRWGTTSAKKGLSVRDYAMLEMMGSLIMAPGQLGEECRRDERTLLAHAADIVDLWLTTREGAEE